jgi:hypothetical protein
MSVEAGSGGKRKGSREKRAEIENREQRCEGWGKGEGQVRGDKQHDASERRKARVCLYMVW